MFSIAEVQTKAINCSSANKSCLLQVVHTKAIAALPQFCDFLNLNALTFDVAVQSILVKYVVQFRAEYCSP